MMKLRMNSRTSVLRPSLAAMRRASLGRSPFFLRAVDACGVKGVHQRCLSVASQKCDCFCVRCSSCQACLPLTDQQQLMLTCDRPQCASHMLQGTFWRCAGPSGRQTCRQSPDTYPPLLRQTRGPEVLYAPRTQREGRQCRVAQQEGRAECPPKKPIRPVAWAGQHAVPAGRMAHWN